MEIDEKHRRFIGWWIPVTKWLDMGEFKHLVEEQKQLHEADFMAEIVIDSEVGRCCLFRTVKESDLLGGREFYDWIKNIEHSGVTALSTVKYQRGHGG